MIEKNIKEPRIIFFDLGKVLVDYDFNLAYNYIKKRSALPVGEFNERIPIIEKLNTVYETGEISSIDFFRSMADILEFNDTIDSLASAWSNIFKPMPKNIDIARELAKAHSLAIISNTSEVHIQFLESNYSFFENFRERIYSHVIGSRKPDSWIYEHSQTIMSAESENSLFIDDRIENILAAKNLGWMTIHLNGAVDLRQALFQAGVKVS